MMESHLGECIYCEAANPVYDVSMTVHAGRVFEHTYTCRDCGKTAHEYACHGTHGFSVRVHKEALSDDQIKRIYENVTEQ